VKILKCKETVERACYKAFSY